MKDDRKTKKQLIEELTALRHELRSRDVNSLSGPGSNNGVAGAAKNSHNPQESDGKYRALVETMNDGIASVDTMGTVTFVNQALARTLGYLPTEIIGREAGCFMDGENRAVLARNMRLRREGGKDPYEITLLAKTGEEATFLLTPSSILDDRGDLVGSFGVLTNITERKEVEEALRRSERMYRDLVETLHEGVWMIDQEACTTFVNESMARMLGYNPVEMMGRSIMEFMDDEGKRAAGTKLDARRAGVKEQHEFTFLRRNGDPLHTLVATSPVMDEDGAYRGALAGVLDISALKETQADLIRNKDRLSRIIQDQSEFVVRWKPDGVRTFVNDSYCDYFGTTPEEALGNTFFPLIIEEDRELVEHRIAALTQENPVSTAAHRVLLPDGTQGWNEWTDRAFFDTDGQVLEYQSVGRDITAKMLADQALRDSEENFRQLAENIGDVFWITNEKFTEVFYTSPVFEKVWGLQPEVLSANPTVWFESVVEEDKPAMAKALQERRAQNPPKGETAVEFRIMHPEKGLRWIRTRTFPVSDGSGRPGRIVGVSTDITDRKAAEERLRQSEERQRLILDSTDDLIFMQDRDGRYLYFSGSRQYGIDEEDMLGKTPYDLFDRELAGRMVDRIRRVMESGDRVTEETVLPWRGMETWFMDQTSPVTDSDGNIVATTTVSRNITLIKEAEKAVLNSERHYRGLVEGTDDLITIVDHKGIISFVNHSCRRIFGYEPFGCVGRSAFDFVHPDDRDKTRTWFEECLKSKLTNSSFENRQVNLDNGEEFHLLWHTNFHCDTDGGLIEVISIARDLTEYKKLELQLLHSEKLESLGVLAGGIAHDFNNLLMGIMGNVGLAQMKVSAESPIHNELGKIENTARVAADLTNQMLAFSGRGSFEIRLIDLSEIITQMDQLLSTAITNKANVIYEIANNLPAIEADVSKVQQVVMNLMTNAADALGDKTGNIKLVTGTAQLTASDIANLYMHEAMEEGVYVFLEVTDTGSGMEAGTFRKLFEPFYTTKTGGRGLGLASVQGIMKTHRGGLALSTAPGKGSTFRAYFPLPENPVKDMAVKVRTDSTLCGSGTVLVVDDEEMVRAVARDILEQRGFSVITASDGMEGVETFEACKDEIGLVILDLTMPVMDGGEAFRKIRETSTLVPVLIVSGYTELDSMKDGLGNDENAGYLQKPFMPDELIEKVMQIMQKEGSG